MHTKCQNIIQDADKCVQLRSTLVQAGQLSEKCGVVVNSAQQKINLVCDKFSNSTIQLKSPWIQLYNRYGALEVSKNGTSLESSSQITMGKKNQPLLSCDCTRNCVSVGNGDLSVQGKIYVNEGVVKSTHVERVTADKASCLTRRTAQLVIGKLAPLTRLRETRLGFFTRTTNTVLRSQTLVATNWEL